MQPGTYVYCTTQFEGFHAWKNAPEEVAYLGYPHRHIFHVKVIVKVEHNDRYVEFITLKNNTNFIIKEAQNKGYFDCSCEDMADYIARNLKATRNMYNVHSVEVSEDGENGAIVVCQ